MEITTFNWCSEDISNNYASSFVSIVHVNSKKSNQASFRLKSGKLGYLHEVYVEILPFPVQCHSKSGSFRLIFHFISPLSSDLNFLLLHIHFPLRSSLSVYLIHLPSFSLCLVLPLLLLGRES